MSNAWSNRFDITQPRIVSGGERLRLKPSGRPSSACVRRSLNKNGSRTGYDKNVAGGYNSDYGKAYNLSYAFNSVNALNAIVDLDDVNYLCGVTCDANGNITEVDESELGKKPTPQTNYLYSYFTYDALNHLTNHRTKGYVAGGTNAWVWTERGHDYDALGRLVRSGWAQYNDGDPFPGFTSAVHSYSGSRLVQNVSSDGQSFGARWHWAGSGSAPVPGGGQLDHGAPLKSPNPDTASQSGYNYAVGGSDVAGGGGAGGASPMRRTFVNPTTEGDQRHVFGQGRPMAKDSSGSGANWYQGTLSAAQNANQNIVESRLFYAGTTGMSGGLDLSRSTDAREKGRLGIFGTAESYAGAYPRVTSESIGRDLNPLGRGDGMGYVGGTLNLRRIGPAPAKRLSRGGQGNSVNNPCVGGGVPGPGAGTTIPPDGAPSDAFSPCLLGCGKKWGSIEPGGSIPPGVGSRPCERALSYYWNVLSACKCFTPSSDCPEAKRDSTGRKILWNYASEIGCMTSGACYAYRRDPGGFFAVQLAQCAISCRWIHLQDLRYIGCGCYQQCISCCGRKLTAAVAVCNACCHGDTFDGSGSGGPVAPLVSFVPCGTEAAAFQAKNYDAFIRFQCNFYQYSAVQMTIGDYCPGDEYIDLGSEWFDLCNKCCGLWDNIDAGKAAACRITCKDLLIEFFLTGMYCCDQLLRV